MYADAMKSIAGMLVTLPDESIENLLVTYDSMVIVPDAAMRPIAAQILRDAAPTSPDATRRDRLNRAADAIAAGRSCAVTDQGLTAQQQLDAVRCPPAPGPHR